MAVPTYPSAITLADIQTEFGGSNPIGINEYYSGGTYVGSGIANSTGTVIPTSGAISYLNFSGAVAYTIDPTQPTVTRTYWHGVWNYSAGVGVGVNNISSTGHIQQRGSSNNLFQMCLDGGGTKVFGINLTSGNALIGSGTFYTSIRNPYYHYAIMYSATPRAFLTKFSNTATAIKSSNIVWGAANTTSYIYRIAVTSGTQNSNTSIYAICASNTNSGNCTTSVIKLNAADMTTVEWAKTTSVIGSDVTANLRPSVIWTNLNESAIFVQGARSTLNTVIVILNAATGATEQNWQTTASYGVIAKATTANNIAFSSFPKVYIKSNTGANIASIGIANSSWENSFLADIDEDSSVYIMGQSREGNTSSVVAMLAKYNSAGVKQWQVKIAPVTSTNTASVISLTASNTRLMLTLLEATDSHSGKDWYQSSTGEYRHLHLDSASCNTGTFGRFVISSNTTSVFGTSLSPANLGLWSYTYSPRTTYDFTFASNTNPTVSSNTVTFTKTAL